MKTLLLHPAPLMIALVLAMASCHRKEEKKPAPPAIQVLTTLAARQDVPIYLKGVGTVTPNATVTVKPRIDGALDKLYYVEGQDVKAGQLLAELDARALRAQLAQQLAARAKDAAQLANARTDLGRYTRLRADDAATQQTLDAQKAQVAQLEAAVQGDDAQINFYKVQIDYTRITAPISGRTGTRLVDAGNIVHAADPNGLVVINQIDPVTVLFTVPEEDVQRIGMAAGDHPLPVSALARDGSTVLATGELVLLNNAVDPATGTIQLKGRLPNPKHLLWPGQYVNMRLRLGTIAGATTVPSPAIQRGPNGSFVYVVKPDGTAAMQKVDLGQDQDGVAVIRDGVQAGQRVVVDGQFKLKPGSRVVEAGKAAAPVAAPAGKRGA